MQSQKKTIKKSTLGTRVCAPWSDGRFYGGTIESVTEHSTGQCFFSVLFDDGYSKSYAEEDLVGPNFRSITATHLKHGQKVYVTYQNKEAQGRVIKHNRRTNCVAIEIDLPGQSAEVLAKLDEIRLFETKKHTKSQEPDGDMIPRIAKRKGSSQVIDVPVGKSGNRRRKHDEIAEEVDMDAQIAAMALQNLSCSPASPSFPLDLSKSPRSWNELSIHRPSPSPPSSHYSSSAPIYGYFGSASTDEGIDVDENLYGLDEWHQKKRKAEDSPIGKIKYKCTWRGCGIKMNDCKSIEAHIRQAHLGPREGSDLSDHEEEFYYEELEELELEDMTLNFTNMHCTSPVQPSPLNLSLHREASRTISPPIGIDHDYQRKDQPGMHTSPILIPGAPAPHVAHFFPQNSPYTRFTHKGSPGSPTAASPKHPGLRKGRSDVKKCRKVYGMDKRELWCTQCKWKKACTRFLNE